MRSPSHRQATGAVSRHIVAVMIAVGLLSSLWHPAFAQTKLADLKISKFSLTPTPVKPGELFTISVSVTNAGKADAPFSFVALFASTQDQDLLDAAGPATLNAGPLAPGATTTFAVSIIIPPIPPGFYVIWATVNPDQLVAEKKETNNTSVKKTVEVLDVSQPLPPSGATFFVAVDGNDSDSGNEAQPFRTISRGVSALGPGDTLLVKTGTYTEALLDHIPSGLSWEQPVTVAAYPGHTVTLKPNPGAGWVLHFQGQQYIIINGFILDGTAVSEDVVKITAGGGLGPAHHIRIGNCEVKNARGSGIVVSQGAHSNEFLSLDVHHNGQSPYEHGIYLDRGESNLVDGSLIHHNAGFGVHVYTGVPNTANYNLVRNNWIYENSDRGLVFSSGTENVAYNNIVWGHPHGGILVAYYNPTHTQLYHNTVYANQQYGIYIETDASDTLVHNNLLYANGTPELQTFGPRTVVAANLVGIDPHFVNPDASDFRLQATSPAIDTGITVSFITTDARGIPRPQGTYYDIGAFEWVP